MAFDQTKEEEGGALYVFSFLFFGGKKRTIFVRQNDKFQTLIKTMEVNQFSMTWRKKRGEALLLPYDSPVHFFSSLEDAPSC